MIHLIAIGMYVQTHILGVLLSMIAPLFIGFLWYGPVFGKPWMEINGLKKPNKEDMKFSMMLPGICASLVMSFVQASVLGRAFQVLLLENMGQAFIIAFILWFPFTALTIICSYAWLGKPVKLMLIDTLFYFASLSAIAAILYVTL